MNASLAREWPLSGDSRKQALVPQRLAEEVAQGWQAEAVNDVTRKLQDPAFPCIFSRNAHKKKLIGFIFVNSWDEQGVRHLSEGLRDYVRISQDWNGKLDEAYPLIVFFSSDAISARDIPSYQEFGWQVLHELERIDQIPWPANVSRDPFDSSWSMCFNGMQLFCNMSTPEHKNRRSRSLGRYFAIVINPRERFDVFAGDTPSGRNTRKNIRRRIQEYDGVTPSTVLGSYGSESLEWKQYVLPDSDTNIESLTCPIMGDRTLDSHAAPVSKL